YCWTAVKPRRTCKRWRAVIRCFIGPILPLAGGWPWARTPTPRGTWMGIKIPLRFRGRWTRMYTNRGRTRKGRWCRLTFFGKSTQGAQLLRGGDHRHPGTIKLIEQEGGREPLKIV